MVIPKHLEQLRDSLAREYSLDSVDTCHFVDFKAGWNALHSHLTAAAGEFDEKAAQAEADSAMENLGPTMFTRDECAAEMVSHARWQFEQDRARIGLAEECLRAANETNARYRAAGMNLEARLQESERANESLVQATYQARDARSNLQDKLTASEARCKELEARDRVCACAGAARGGTGASGRCLNCGGRV